MTVKLVLDTKAIASLDLSSAKNQIVPLLDKKIADYEQQLQFEIKFQRGEDDPRELS